MEVKGDNPRIREDPVDPEDQAVSLHIRVDLSVVLEANEGVNLDPEAIPVDRFPHQAVVLLNQAAVFLHHYNVEMALDHFRPLTDQERHIWEAQDLVDLGVHFKLPEVQVLAIIPVDKVLLDLAEDLFALVLSRLVDLVQRMQDQDHNLAQIHSEPDQAQLGQVLMEDPAYPADRILVGLLVQRQIQQEEDRNQLGQLDRTAAAALTLAIMELHGSTLGVPVGQFLLPYP